ncbi:MAG: hypothetical protein HYW48_03695 [Deltaproteobacteria bacterium]|nr:hypothetical protein [Deltaproteobacteria bacterium]
MFGRNVFLNISYKLRLKQGREKRERGVWGGEGKACPEQSEGSLPHRFFLEEPAAQFPPNHLLAPSGLRITD